MTDAEFEGLKSKLMALDEMWCETLGLRWWALGYVYDRQGKKPSSGTFSEVARCDVKWWRKVAVITFDMPALLKSPDDELEKVFVHELMHIFLHEARELDNGDSSVFKHEERVATDLTSAFLWLKESLTKDKEA